MNPPEPADILGMAFDDYLKGQTDAVIEVEVDIAGSEELPVSYFFRSPEQMPVWERMALDRCRGRVLDVGAGAGCHALALQERGYEVWAIDISPGAVNTMRGRGVGHPVCSDFFRFGEKEFDTLLFLMNGAGIARNLDGLRRLLEHARGLLTAGGGIIIESTDLLYMYEEEDGSICLPMGHKYYGEVVYRLSYRGIQGRPFGWMFVDYGNLSGIALECGFIPDMIYQGETHNYLAELRLPC